MQRQNLSPTRPLERRRRDGLAPGIIARFDFRPDQPDDRVS